VRGPELVRNGRATRLNVVVVSFKNDAGSVEGLISPIKLAGERAGHETVFTLVVNDESDYSGLASRAQILQGQGNIGYGRGIKLGIAAVPSDFVFVLNPDCVVTTESIQPLFERLGSDSEVLLPLIQKYRGQPDVDLYESWVFTPTRRLSKIICGWFLRRSHAERIPRFVKAPGTALAMTRQLADELGPFDDDFFLYGEDRDFTFRARRRRVTLRLVRDAKILHPGGVSGRSVRSLVARSQSDSMLRIAYRRYGRLGLQLMKLNLVVESWIKDRVRGSSTLDDRLWAIRRWKGPLRGAPIDARVDFLTAREID